MDLRHPLKLCVIFLTACAVILGGVYIVRGNMGMGLLVALSVAVVDVVYFARRKHNNLVPLSYFVVLAAVVIIFMTQVASGNIMLSVPLIMVAAAMSALFFDLRLIKLSFVLCGVLFAAEFAILSLMSGGLVITVVIFAECMVAIIAMGFLVYSSAKNGLKYLREADEKAEETRVLLKDLDHKNNQTEEMFTKQGELLRRIRSVSDNLFNASDSISSQAENLSLGAQNQMESVNTLTSSISLISDQIRETDTQAQQVREASETMRENVNVGNESMNTMLSAMDDIQNSMQAIEVIIKNINDIALQTNLLALNASVEAARAGAAGKGFAVVAGEVRNLAQRSVSAVNSTVEVLENCENAVKRGHQVAKDTSSALSGIKTSTEEVSGLAHKISDMTRIQMDKVEEISREISAVTSVVQTTSATAEESSSSVRELSKQAKMLHDLSKTE
ncbi:MAG: hypothetical protein IKZ30_02655 [Oscillospiraceae bacterium]|nr:hypothetical protein [Oscillospiraceae bacterium]